MGHHMCEPVMGAFPNCWDRRECVCLSTGCLAGHRCTTHRMPCPAYLALPPLGLRSVLRRYGVGQIHFRQEKYEMAEYHFRRSLQVHLLFWHPDSSCLLDCTKSSMWECL